MNRKLVKSITAVALPSMLLLSGCPQQCAPAAPNAEEPAAAPGGGEARSALPSGSGATQFVEDFSNPRAFADRFVTFAGNFIDPNLARTADLPSYVDTPNSLTADHDMSCGDPNATKRTLNIRGGADAADASKFFFQCLPGGDPAKGHVMTAFDQTGYGIMAFSPNQAFNNVSQICWDVNATNEGGGKWTNVVVVPDSLYKRFPSSDTDGKGTDGYRLDYVTEGFNNQSAPGDYNVQAADHPGVDVWGVKDFLGTQTQFIGDDRVFHSGDQNFTTTDHAARYQHCVTNNAGGAELSVARPDGSTARFQLPRAIPGGAVRVIFQDDMYDPPKREGYSPNSVTWHWDNIRIS